MALKEVGLKECTGCHEIKVLGDFYVRGSGEVYPACKKCNSVSCKPRCMTRRARLRKAFVEVVSPQILFEQHGGICGICNQEIEGDFHVDHVIPLAKGGEHSYANTQPAHPRCNRWKGTKMFTPTRTAAIG